jgi:hypothetical protein
LSAGRRGEGAAAPLATIGSGNLEERFFLGHGPILRRLGTSGAANLVAAENADGFEGDLPARHVIVLKVVLDRLLVILFVRSLILGLFSRLVPGLIIGLFFSLVFHFGLIVGFGVIDYFAFEVIHAITRGRWLLAGRGRWKGDSGGWAGRRLSGLSILELIFAADSSQDLLGWRL